MGSACLRPHALRAGGYALRAVLLCLVCLSASAQQPQTHFQLDAGAGHEEQSSPLFQVSPDSTLVYPGDLNRLSGSHWLTNLQGQVEWALDDGIAASVGASANLKQSPSNPDFDFMALSLQPSVHMPLGAASVGLGLTVQTMDVAQSHFQDSTGVQLDWTLADGADVWGLVLEQSQYRHSGDLTDLDSTSQSLVLLHQIDKPLPGLDGLDLSAILGSETNAHGYDDLSQHSAMFTATVHWSWLGADWSAGRAWRQVRFDDTSFPGEPPRQDRSDYLDLAAQWPLSATQSVRIAYNQADNRSTTRLYDNVYRQISVMLRSSF